MLGIAAATGLMLASHFRFLISMAMLLMIIGVTIILRIPWLSHIVEPVVAATIAIGLYTLGPSKRSTTSGSTRRSWRAWKSTGNATGSLATCTM